MDAYYISQGDEDMRGEWCDSFGPSKDSGLGKSGNRLNF
jgi:hypothetical protein